MLNTFAKATVLGCLGLFAAYSQARAQTASPFSPTPASRYEQLDSRQTVSPYLNLATTNGGLSNYQSLVRPLIEERAELNRQWTELERLNQRLGAPNVGSRGEPGRGPVGGRSSAVRFMHYSHYFGGRR